MLESNISKTNKNNLLNNKQQKKNGSKNKKDKKNQHMLNKHKN